MKKSKRLKTGFLGSVFFHILVLVFLGISLSLYVASIPKTTDKILEVSLVSGGGGKQAGGKITVANPKVEAKQEKLKTLPDDIVEKKENIQEEILPPAEENVQQQEQNASNATGPSNNKEGNGSGGSDSGSGGGDGTGAGSGQGDDEGAGAPVTPPRLISRVEPIYPATERKNEVEGTTSVRLLVSADGSVESVGISNSSGSGLLDSAAVEAASQWSFVPAKDERGRAVRCYVSLPVTFRLR